MQKRAIVFGTYNHLAEGSPSSLFEDTYQICWRPFLSSLYRYPGVSSVLHYSGTVLQWLQGKHPEFIMLLEEMANRKQIELIGGSYFAALLPVIPGPDRVGQLEYLTTYIRKLFGRRPRGAWTHEFAWEPSLASTYQACGFDYTFLPRELFASANLEPGAPVVTEDQGKNISVFPVSDLESCKGRILGPSETLGRLCELDRDSPLVTLMFPDYATREIWAASGEVTPDLAFEASFAAIQAMAPDFETTTPGRYLRTLRGAARAYFACSSSPLLASRSQAAGREEACAVSALRMTPRSLLLRYPESAALYSKMQYVRILVGQLRGDKSRKKSALEELWRGQGNDAYWHGNEGGLLSLPIRAAAYSALIEAERTSRHKGLFLPGIIRADLDLDGEKEVLYQGTDFNAYIHHDGAVLTELDSLRSLTNYVNAMDGEAGRGRLACLVDRACAIGSFDGERRPSGSRYILTDGALPSMTAAFTGSLPLARGKDAPLLKVVKVYSFRKGNLGVHYCLSHEGREVERLRFVTELNLTAGTCPDASRLRTEAAKVGLSAQPAESDALFSFGVDNVVAGERLDFRSERAFSLRSEPLYLEGLVRGKPQSLYQGSRLSLGWDLDLAPGRDELISLNLELGRM